MSPAVHVQTNDAGENEVVTFSRAEDGTLAPLGRYPTGGRGTGEPHLASAGSVALSGDGQWLLVANAGSDELSLFAVQPDGLRLADRVGSGGAANQRHQQRHARLRSQQRYAEHQRLHC